jgi:hypothetical protein
MTQIARDKRPAVVCAHDADYCIATWYNMFVVIFRKETRMDVVQALPAHLKPFAAAHPHGIGLLTIIEQHAPAPPSEVRAAVARFLSNCAGTVKASAVAFEGTGFRAAMVRGVVTGVNLLARLPYPHQVFATVPDGANWLSRTAREVKDFAIDSPGLIAAVADLRTRINRDS